ncbi:hypothetical protein QO004_003029 [Rhizobium mesoamericanum]|nr:hypothetical protein [Rhizobium mesoamericanum]
MSQPNYNADSPVQFIDPYNDFLSENGKALPRNSAITSRRGPDARTPLSYDARTVKGSVAPSPASPSRRTS